MQISIREYHLPYTGDERSDSSIVLFGVREFLQGYFSHFHEFYDA